jgi:hypothetical protein
MQQPRGACTDDALIVIATAVITLICGILAAALV